MSAAVLVASAAGAPARGSKSINPRALGVVALAIDGNRVAYADVVDSVLVWNLRTGRTTRLSGREWAGSAVEVAIAGSHVVWHTTEFSISSGGDYLFTSSLLKPKQRLVEAVYRSEGYCGALEEPAPCAGNWISGVVASGKRILVGRWTTDASGSAADSGLYELSGARLKLVTGGTGAVEALAADSKRVALLHADGTIAVYSAAGKSLSNVTPSVHAEAVALSGRNLLVLEPKRGVALYDAATGPLRKTFAVRGHPEQLGASGQALAVRGNVAVYSTPVQSNGRRITKSAIRALNLSSGKDRPLGRAPGRITLARFGSRGLVYNGGHGLVFEPFRQVAAAVQ